MTGAVTAGDRHAQSGFTLIEILVSALLVGTVSLGVLKGIDVSSRASAASKGRGIAVSLAQQDQERLRAMPVSQLATVDSTRDVQTCANGSSGCVTYHVASKSGWVADTSAPSTCSLSGARSYNLQITSTVTWDGQGTAKDVVMQSLVAAPPGTSGGGQGSLAVRIREVDGVTPVAGISVSLTGPDTRTGTTDANGCVVWDYLPGGSGYMVSFNDPGYWDPSGQHAVSRAVSVVGQRLITQSFTYSPGATVDFTFKAYAGDGNAYTTTNDRVTLERQGVPVQVLGTPGAQVSRVRARNLAPANDYTAYAGDCPAEQITTSVGSFRPWLGNVTGGALSNATIYLVGIRDVFKTAGRTDYSGDAIPYAHFTQRAAGCPQDRYDVHATPGGGYLKGFGLPRGTYDICVEAYVPGRDWYRQEVTGQAINNTATNGHDIAGGWDITSTKDRRGRCP